MSCVLRLEALAYTLRAIPSIDITEQAARACKIVAKVPSARQRIIISWERREYALPLP